MTASGWRSRLDPSRQGPRRGLFSALVGAAMASARARSAHLSPRPTWFHWRRCSRPPPPPAARCPRSGLTKLCNSNSTFYFFSNGNDIPILPRAVTVAMSECGRRIDVLGVVGAMPARTVRGRGTSRRRPRRSSVLSGLKAVMTRDQVPWASRSSRSHISSSRALGIFLFKHLSNDAGQRTAGICLIRSESNVPPILRRLGVLRISVVRFDRSGRHRTPVVNLLQRARGAR